MAQKPENEGMPVIRLDRQLKYQGNILKIYEDTVLANGHEAHWDYIHHDGAAAVLPVTHWIVLLWRSRQESWMIPKNPKLSVRTGNWRRKRALRQKNWNI